MNKKVGLFLMKYLMLFGAMTFLGYYLDYKVHLFSLTLGMLLVLMGWDWEDLRNNV